MIPKHRAGFTLVEMAVVLVIIGLVMLTVFPALNAVRSANERAMTQSNLHSLMVATAAYVQANGCLPCPANAAGVGSNFGRLGYSANVACGTCSVAQGIAPFVALGIPAATARDGWGHWITMRVDPALTVNFAVTPPTAACQCADFTAANLPASCPAAQAGLAANTLTCTALNASQKGLCQSGLNTQKRIGVTLQPAGATQQAAVIFVSHGATGYGSYFAQPVATGSNGQVLPFSSGYAACSAGGYAQCNSAGNNSPQFVDAPMMTGDTNSYDDVLAYADRNTLVSMLGNGSCQTVW